MRLREDIVKMGKVVNRVKDYLVNSKSLILMRVVAVLASITTLLWPTNAFIEARWFAIGVVLVIVALTLIEFLVKRYDRIINWITYAAVVRKYGYGYEYLTVKCDLSDRGGMRCRRKIRIRAAMVLTTVRHYLSTLGEASDVPPSIVGFHSSDGPRDVSISASKNPEFSSKTKAVTEVVFTPYLEAGDAVTYELDEVFPPGSFATTKDEMEHRHLPHEYFAWHITRPAKFLCLSVFIPASLNPVECGFDVWYGDFSRQRHRQERQRLAPFFTVTAVDQHKVLKLHVPYPVIGLYYTVRWGYA